MKVSTHVSHFNASAEIGQFDVTIGGHEHVVRLNVTVDKTHSVYGVQGEHQFGRVKSTTSYS